LHYGDSNVAADLWTAVARRTLQARFGDGGAGYLVPRPHGSWNRSSASVRAGSSWKTRRLGFAKRFGPVDGLWGLAGVAMEASAPRSWLEIRVPSWPEGAQVELHLLGRANGGRLAVAVDRGPTKVVDTKGAGQTLVVHRLALASGTHKVRARLVGAEPVRVLGAVVERRRPGVVYDVLGINGHRVTAISQWVAGLIKAQLSRRPADLVVLSYGGNEGLDHRLTLAEYERQLRSALGRVRTLAPKASCLLTGPVAMCPERPRVTKIAQIQRRVAPEFGCGFWDSAAVGGGPGSLCQWIRADPTLVARDRLHLRQAGYEIIGRQFTRALLAGL
jgi:lysophospholipase L1-like esterase